MTAQPRLSHLVLAGDISVLRRLHGMLERGTIVERDEFKDMMRAAFHYSQLDYKLLADDLGYSSSAVYRWVEGGTAPHPGLWPRVIEWVMRAIEQKVDHLESEVVDSNGSELAPS